MTKPDEELLASIAETFADVTDVAAADVRPDRLLIDDLEIDSLSMAELGVALQDKFDIELSDDEIAELKTVADIVELLREAQIQV